VVPGGCADLRRDGDDLSLADRRVFVIFNPASGRGRGRRRQDAYLKLLGEHVPGFEHAVTSGPGDEYRLADQAIDDGFDTIVAVGGDGTWSHVADRILASGREGMRLGLLPSGTGNDFGRSLGLSFSDPAAAVRSLASGRTRRIDAGRINTPSAPAEPGKSGSPTATERVRHFLNLVGFGFDIAVIDAAAGARFLKGEALYKITALQQLFRFPGIQVALERPDGPVRNGRHLMVTISNSPYFGGGFPIAPRASVEDGMLHACLIGDASPFRRMKLFGDAGKGRHVDADEVEIVDGASFTARFDAPVRFEADGDVFSVAGNELSVEILPGALDVLAG
jgi:diacylglycerol kinase (ATP)